MITQAHIVAALERTGPIENDRISKMIDSLRREIVREIHHAADRLAHAAEAMSILEAHFPEDDGFDKLRAIALELQSVAARLETT